MAVLCLDCVDGLDLDDSYEDSTLNYETLVSQHKDSLYYSESDEKIAEGRSKNCYQKENLDFLQTIHLYKIMTMFQMMLKTLKCLNFCSSKYITGIQ
jgi:hypothetical protein